MPPLPLLLLRQACRVFLDLAYPDGPESIPEPIRAYGEIPDDADVAEYLPPSPRANGMVRALSGPHPGFSIRLGCVDFPYLRLTLQLAEDDGVEQWLCGVDTHDSWHHPEHPDAAAWLAIQSANRDLKSRIERMLESAGLLTQNLLLRHELARHDLHRHERDAAQAHSHPA